MTLDRIKIRTPHPRQYKLFTPRPASLYYPSRLSSPTSSASIMVRLPSHARCLPRAHELLYINRASLSKLFLPAMAPTSLNEEVRLAHHFSDCLLIIAPATQTRSQYTTLVPSWTERSSIRVGIGESARYLHATPDRSRSQRPYDSVVNHSRRKLASGR